MITAGQSTDSSRCDIISEVTCQISLDENERSQARAEVADHASLIH